MQNHCNDTFEKYLDVLLPRKQYIQGNLGKYMKSQTAISGNYFNF